MNFGKALLSNKSTLLTVSSVAALIGAFQYIRSRKRKAITLTQSETFYVTRNASWFSLSSLAQSGSSNSSMSGKPNERARLDSTSSDAPNGHQHPEGPNIGFDSNPSWLHGSSQKKGVTFTRSDLHRGNSKGAKLMVALVGLPGRGKTYIGRKIARYLRWISYRTRAFSLAKYRLDRLGTKTADFFDPTCSTNYNQRTGLMMEALDDALRYLSRGGEIAILDGTNTTRDRRDLIRQRVAKEEGYDILWIESLDESGDDITDKQLEELRNSPDFLDKVDYERRMNYYKANYESLQDDEGSFIKVYNGGRSLHLHEIHGFLRSKIVSFVMNLHTESRPIYITRHGESEFNVRGIIGGDSGLSPRGILFSKALAEFMFNEELSKEEAEQLCVWTSNMRRARETALEMKCRPEKLVEWRSLREIEVGVCDGLSYEQVKTQFPEEYRARVQDKLRYRYPRGESYLDVIARLEPVIFELERQKGPVLVAAHQAVLRCLYAYFLDMPLEEIPFLSIPLHTLIRLETKAYGCKEKRMKIVIDEKQ